MLIEAIGAIEHIQSRKKVEIDRIDYIANF